MNRVLPPAEIEERLRRLPEWHYEFDLGGVKTKIRDPSWVNRHQQRRRYLFDPIADAGLVAGRRVLDLGCNAGFWSLAAIEAGCAHVRGLDARSQHVAQAELVFEANGIPRDRYEFRQVNVFDPGALTGEFDIVLCLGLLYHVSKPIELLERIAALEPKLLLIDSTLAPDRDALLRVSHDPLDDPRMSADYSLVFVPSAPAVAEMAEAVGYRCVALRPEFDDWDGCDDFRTGKRLGFACARTIDPATVFAAAVDPRAATGELRGLGAEPGSA